MSNKIMLNGKHVLPVIEDDVLGGVQWVYRFANGYGGSVINHSGSYGVELAVVEWDDWLTEDDDYTICYTTPVTGDVLGWLTFDELVSKLGEVQALPFKRGSKADIFSIKQYPTYN